MNIRQTTPLDTVIACRQARERAVDASAVLQENIECIGELLDQIKYAPGKTEKMEEAVKLVEDALIGWNELLEDVSFSELNFALDELYYHTIKALKD